MVVLIHCSSRDVEDDGLASPRADFGRGGFVGGEVNVVARPFLATAGSDTLNERGHGSVIERFGWCLFLKLQVDSGHRVALAGSNPQPVFA